MKWPRKPFSFGIVRFGLVGVLATLVHGGFYLLLTRYGVVNPVIANVIGFVLAFALSYSGHSGWTFADHGVRHRTGLAKFLCLSIGGQLINFGWTWLFVVHLHYPSRMGLVGIGILIPALSYFGNRYWVFRNSGLKSFAGSRP